MASVVASNAGWQTGASIPTSWASTPTEGHTVICRAAINSTAAVASLSGWTLVADQPNPNNAYVHQYIWSKTAGPAEPAPTIGVDASVICGWDLLELDAAYDLAAETPDYSTSSGATIDFPAGTVAETGSLVIHHGFHKMGGVVVGAFTPGTGLTAGEEVLDDTRPGGHGALVVYATEESSSTSARDCTYTGSNLNHWVGSTIVATPAGAGGGGGGSTPTATFGSFSTDDSETGGSQATAVLPSHTTGDLLVLFVAADNGGSVSFTDPSGWTKLGEQNGDGSIIGVWTRTATSASETDPVVGLGAPEDYAAVAVNLGDAEIDVSAFAASATSPSVTTTVDNCRVVRFAGANDSGTISWATSTEIAEQASPLGGVVVASITSDEQATAGASGTDTITASSGAVPNSVAVAFNTPSGGAPDPVVPQTTGNNANGAKWIAVKITRGAAVDWATAEFTLDNTVTGGGGGGTPPTPDPEVSVPLGNLRQRLAIYQGNDAALARVRAQDLGLSGIGVGCTYQAAPDEGSVGTVRSLIRGYIYGNAQVPGALAYPDQFACFNIHVADARTSGGVNPANDATLQASYFQSVLNGDWDSDIEQIVTAFGALVDATPGIHHFLRLGHEVNLEVQRLGPHAANLAQWGDVVHYWVDKFAAGLSAAQLECLVFDFSVSKRNSRAGVTHETLLAEVVDVVRTASINAYLDKAPGASAHVTPAGPFGPTDIDNILTAAGRAGLYSAMVEGADRMEAMRTHFLAAGLPVGMGEGAAGTGLASQSIGRRAQWCHDDPDAVSDWVGWWSQQQVPFWSVQIESGGGVGVRMNELPDAWARLRSELLALPA